jgi:peptidoglycan hydrolase-like protein with peptidoglycan-binding domain
MLTTSSRAVPFAGKAQARGARARYCPPPTAGAAGMRFVGTALHLQHEGLTAAAEHIAVDPTTLWSVVVVETSGCGFLPDRRPTILFERHTFRKLTGRRFDAAHPGISGPAGGYGPGGAHQYERLEEAAACDRQAALESASWGLGQIMGFNAGLAGFHDAEEMVERMMRGENEQLLAMATFIGASRMHTALQRRDWVEFARSYNGPSYEKNRYHEKLAAAHANLSARGLPDLEARAVQLLLTYHGFNPGKIDGIVGERTRVAISAFTTKQNLSGLADHKDLRSVLLEMLPPAAEDRRAPSSLVPATPHAAPDLRVVQSLLEYLGRKPGPVDGRVGPRTRNAIYTFRQPLDAVATGEVDAGLIAALVAEAKRNFGRNNNADTRLVQRLLAIGGFDPGKIDGLVGPRTRTAISAFAQLRGISPTDAVDAGLVDALLAPYGNGAGAAPRA